MSPDTIKSMFVADFPGPDIRFSAKTADAMIQWITRNWDSLNREELTLFLSAAELLVGAIIENAWGGTTEGEIVVDPATGPHSQVAPITKADTDAQAASWKATNGKWRDAFPWKPECGPRIAPCQ